MAKTGKPNILVIFGDDIGMWNVGVYANGMMGATHLDVYAGLEGVKVRGPLPQGEWLGRMGIQERAEALARGAPEHAADIDAARQRLIDPARMGELFKALALVAPAWPEAAAFG